MLNIVNTLSQSDNHVSEKVMPGLPINNPCQVTEPEIDAVINALSKSCL